MANTIQIKHGSSAPTTSNLAPFELGYVKGGALYINNDGVINQLTSPELINMVSNGKLSISQFSIINKAQTKEGKILVANNDNQLLYRSPEEILLDIKGFSIDGGTINGETIFAEKIILEKEAFFNGAIILKEGVSFGYVDPNVANIPGVKGQIYIVLSE